MLTEPTPFPTLVIERSIIALHRDHVGIARHCWSGRGRHPRLVCVSGTVQGRVDGEADFSENLFPLLSDESGEEDFDDKKGELSEFIKGRDLHTPRTVFV